VPVEPSEGNERIRRLMSATRASLILCTEANRRRLEEIAASLDDPIETPYHLASLPDKHNLYQSNQATVLDFSKIVQHATQDMMQSQLSNRERLDQELNRCWQSECSLLETLTKCAQLLSSSSKQDNSQTDYWFRRNRMSHCAFTSGSTGVPKGSTSSIESLNHYIRSKNKNHEIDHNSVLLLASALSFDPCFSDILASLQARATLGIARRTDLSQNLSQVLRSLKITHVLCTPSLWGSLLMMSGGRPRDMPHLRVVALGGEPIPKQIVQTWARRKTCKEEGIITEGHCRLFATYGVTEATVYQTMGEVVLGPSCSTTRSPPSHHVGTPFGGMHARICQETIQDKLVDVEELGGVGEVVLYGCQLDQWSFYLNNPQQTQQKFLTLSIWNTVNKKEEKTAVYYRTGDRGFIDADTGNLAILGRIGGEEGMVKINGVRVELGEIETALVDDCDPTADDVHPVVIDAAVVARQDESHSSALEIHAYCVLSQPCADEMKLTADLEEKAGILCNSKAMLTLLQARCKEKVRAGCTPSAFIFCRKIPITATGKRHVAALPKMKDCKLQENANEGTALYNYGKYGAFLADQISTCLNLQACQQSMLTTSVSFSMLGGDSLAATRIARALYAHHHNLSDSRFLGGQHGAFEGPFSPIRLVSSPSLGDYVDCLDRIPKAAISEGEREETSKEMCFQEAAPSDNQAVDITDGPDSILFGNYSGLYITCHGIIGCRRRPELG
jgi:acyl-coenzyme A synthetase/AMP-(fatty) acid ligase